MPQKTSPFLEGKWGWNYGESGWNSGADENWLKFSYMFDANVDAIVSTLPAAVNGEAYFLTTDNRIYFVVDGSYYSTPVPKWFEFKVKSTGVVYKFTGSVVEPVLSAYELETTLATDQGAGKSGYSSSETYPTNTVGYELKSQGAKINDLEGDVEELLLGNKIVSPLQFGAMGDGAAIQLAIDYVNSIGGGVVEVPNGTWSFPDLTTLTLYSKVHLKGIGKPTFDFSDRSGGYESLYKSLIEARGSFESGINLSSNLAKNAWVVNASTTGLLEGDLIIITSDATIPGDTVLVKAGEYAIVDEILSATSFRINNSTFSSYLVADNARYHVVRPVMDILVENIHFLGQGRLDPAAGDLGLIFTYGRRIVVRDCFFDKIDMYQLEFRSCYDFKVESCSFYHTKYTSSGSTPGVGRPVAIVPRGPVQYQVRVSDCCQYGVISNCVGDGSRHFFNTGHSFRADDGNPAQQVGYLFGLSRHIKIENCMAKNTWHACFSTHNDSEYIEFINCVAENSGLAGYNPRHRNIKLTNCLARDCNVGFRLSEAASDISLVGCVTDFCNVDVECIDNVQFTESTILIEGCNFNNSLSGLSMVPSSGSNSGRLIIKNCKFYKCVMVATGNACPIRVEGVWTSVVVDGCQVDGTVGPYCIRLLATTPFAAVTGCIVINGLRPVNMGSGVTRGIVANCVGYNNTVNAAFVNTSTTPTLQNNI